MMALAAYLPVARFAFLNLDDSSYVTYNRNVLHGFSWKSVSWAITNAGYTGNWHPLTWLSHMADIELFGLDPGSHHLMNLFLHTASTALLFIVLRSMTGAFWRSAVVAALFAVHPLNVESVAWVAERKNVLSTALWFLTVGAYGHYVRRPRVGAYLGVISVFALGLAAKPMLVTMPFVLLLLDYWPFGRIRQGRPIGEGLRHPEHAGTPLGRILAEKIPFFVLAGAVIVLTLVAQQAGGALGSMDKYPIWARIANAFVSYLRYPAQMLWPSGLAVFYPIAIAPLIQGVMAFAVLLAITGTLLTLFRNLAFMSMGWLWYLGTLVPVIGFVQVGLQSRADRYTYIPLVGLFVMLAWGVDTICRSTRIRAVAVLLMFMVMSSFLMTTRLQVSYWRNTKSLFTHALGVTANNWMAHNILGKEFYDQGNLDVAIGEFRTALGLTGC
jgi:hypothetical protein